MKYRKKPVVIDACQLHAIDCTDCPQWLQDLLINSELCEIHDNHITIKTLEGCMMAKKGDYIIRGIKGEMYPCKANIFEMTYEIVLEGGLIK